MEANTTIADLGAKLDAWFDENVDIFKSRERRPQIEALVRGAAIVTQLDRLTAEGLAALHELIVRQEARPEDQRKTSLVKGFEFGARLRHTLHDELLDTEAETKVGRSMHAIVQILDSTAGGRIALAELLDHPDPGVRASAGAYLIDLIPDQVVPLLRDIDQSNRGLSADFTAHWILVDWELKRRGAPAKNSGFFT